MASQLRFSSYNCRGLPKNNNRLHIRPDILKLFECSDVVCLQETWLAKQELDLANNLHTEFLAASVAKVDFSEGLLIGRPHGGVSIFYKRSLSRFVTPIYFQNCDWCVAIKCRYGSTSFTIFNVYLPYENFYNEDEFVEKLGLLESFIESIDEPTFAIVGDFNSNISLTNGSLTSKFAKIVIDFCDQNSIILSSQIMLPSDSHTCISERWGTTSWLDLLVSSPDFHRSVCNLKIEYNLSSNDHIPFCFTLCTSTLPPININDTECDFNLKKKVRWKDFTTNQCSIYKTFTDLFHDQYNLAQILPVCRNPNCNDSRHRVMLDNAYNTFVNCLISSTDKVDKVRNDTKNNKAPRKPGWSDYVKEKHMTAVEFYKLWRDKGKPRQGPFYDHYHRSKLNYKYAVRAIKRKTDSIKADKMASKLYASDYSGFWDSVRQFNRNKTVLPQKIGKAVGEQNICNEWKNHFKSIYNSVINSSDDSYVNCNINNEHIEKYLFTEAELLIAVLLLGNNKSSGFDCIFAEHIKNCSVSMLRFLCKLFNCFLMHGYLPESFMSVLISPVFKKKGSICDIDAYRPIALANCLSKLYEALMRDKIIIYLSTSNNQFGYKRKLGTEMCLFAFKEIVDCYNKLDTNIYCCFLDASRAYDRVSHRKMFAILNERGVPLIFIRILAYWYKHQNLYIKWGKCISSAFTVTNGVRQGSVLSPYLFCVYFDKISQQLNGVKIGCKLRNLLINHLFYADDLCIFSPSSRGLQKLLDICFECGSDLDIIFNELKCKIMVFKAKTYQKCPVPNFYIGDAILEICSSYKYLGHFVTDTKSDNIDISRQCRSIFARGNTLIRTFYKCSDVVKVALFKSYCSSFYTAELWSNYTQAAIRKLTVAYHSIFKKMLNFPRNTSNSLVFVYYSVPTFQEIIRKSIFSFTTRLYTSDNTLIKDLILSEYHSSSSLSERWSLLLF